MAERYYVDAGNVAVLDYTAVRNDGDPLGEVVVTAYLRPLIAPDHLGPPETLTVQTTSTGWRVEVDRGPGSYQVRLQVGGASKGAAYRTVVVVEPDPW